LPTASEQVATVVGVDGSGLPLTSLASHIPRLPGAALHHWEERQSASVLHSAVQSPLVVSQFLPECP
jgi:orotate phosphoribosyltransferase-like protein